MTISDLQYGFRVRPKMGEVVSDIHVEVSTDLAETEMEWKSFEQEADCTVFQLYDWMSEWLRHIGSKRAMTPAIVFGRVVGNLLFILPLAVEQRGLVRHLVWFGSDLCDYNMPLLGKKFSNHIKPQEFVQVWQKIVRMIQATPGLHFDIVEMSKMPVTVGEQANPFCDLPVLNSSFSGHRATLPQGSNWEEFYAANRSSRTRHTDRRKLKNLGKIGTVRFVEPQDRNDRDRTIATLIRQKRESLARMKVLDLFARPGYSEFYHSISANPRLRDIVHVHRLDVGETPAATGFGLKHNGCYYLVVSSYEASLSKYSPGNAHVHEMLRYAISQNMRLFDFTIGDEAYKLEWSDIRVGVFTYLKANTVKGAVMVVIRVVLHWIDVQFNAMSASWLKRSLSKFRRWSGL